LTAICGNILWCKYNILSKHIQFKNAVCFTVEDGGWEEVAKTVKLFDQLLDATIRGDAEVNHSAQGAINQIKNKNYTYALFCN